MSNQPETATPVTNWAPAHARRYLEARYGKDVWFRAPETFENLIERWLWAVASGAAGVAGESITAIEHHFANREETS